MAATWEQADVFPIIARIINEAHASNGGYVTHDKIAVTLILDTQSLAIIEEAQQDAEDDITADWIAHNMVAWFSQRISVGNSDWQDSFDRVKIDSKWAYKPKTAVG